MIVAVLLAAALAAGVDPRRVVVLAVVTYSPLLAAALVAVILWKSRPDEEGRPALFCEGVASELRAGASLRAALATAATSVGITAPPFGSAMTGVAAHVAEAFPMIGEELRLTVINAARTGSDTAALFDEIGSVALAQAEIGREVRTATAPGRATALLLIGAPLLYMWFRLSSGRFESLFASTQQRYVALIGFGLFMVGLVAVAWIVWRAGR